MPALRVDRGLDVDEQERLARKVKASTEDADWLHCSLDVPRGGCWTNHPRDVVGECINTSCIH
eukprot:8947978-Prorocentrum_lima.AAC.1